jgi:flavin-dependent dehydrogenase
LAESDLIAEVLRLETEVVDIIRRDEADDVSFQIHCRSSAGQEIIHEAEVVIDATGAERNNGWFAKAEADAELSFLNPAADVYILGSKSRPELPFTFATGLAQIRELFAILGDREDLDIYATMPPLA